jgi:hypothetical protein
MPKMLAGVTFTGLEEFKQELQLLTENLVDEANTIMHDFASDALVTIQGAYPRRSGNLRRGLRLRPERGRVITGVTLVQTAPHGWIYEHGTRDRETTAGANRGHMEPTPTFEPIANDYHHAAIDAVITRLYAHGATSVSGEAA